MGHPLQDARRHVAYWLAALLVSLSIVCVALRVLVDDNEPTEANAVNLFQIVDEPFAPDERAILEFRPYQHFLMKCKDTTEHALHKSIGKEQVASPDYWQLRLHADRYRGKIIVVRRGAIVEVNRAKLPAEFGMPGFCILHAQLMSQRHEFYELRILCPPDSVLYDQLLQGIQNGRNPILRVSGYFMKNHSRATDPKGECVCSPLLVCPEPSIERRAGTVNAYAELQENGLEHRMFTRAIDIPRTNERLVVVLARGDVIWTLEEGKTQVPGSLKEAFERFKERLPEDQRQRPSAVIVYGDGVSRESVCAATKTLKDMGVVRVFEKRQQP